MAVIVECRSTPRVKFKDPRDTCYPAIAPALLLFAIDTCLGLSSCNVNEKSLVSRFDPLESH